MLLQVITYKYVWLNWILLLLFGIGTYYFFQLSSITGLLMLNLFDMYGYDFVLRRHWQGVQPSAEIVTAYRIIQKMFEGLIILLIFILFGWQFALGCFLLIWFGVQDLIYYHFLDYELPKKWDWVRWTPFGIMFGDLFNWQMYLQAGIGILIVIMLVGLI